MQSRWNEFAFERLLKPARQPVIGFLIEKMWIVVNQPVILNRKKVGTFKGHLMINTLLRGFQRPWTPSHQPLFNELIKKLPIKIGSSETTQDFATCLRLNRATVWTYLSESGERPSNAHRRPRNIFRYALSWHFSLPDGCHMEFINMTFWRMNSQVKGWFWLITVTYLLRIWQQNAEGTKNANNEALPTKREEAVSGFQNMNA